MPVDRPHWEKVNRRCAIIKACANAFFDTGSLEKTGGTGGHFTSWEGYPCFSDARDKAAWEAHHETWMKQNPELAAEYRELVAIGWTKPAECGPLFAEEKKPAHGPLFAVEVEEEQEHLEEETRGR